MLTCETLFAKDNRVMSTMSDYSHLLPKYIWKWYADLHVNHVCGMFVATEEDVRKYIIGSMYCADEVEFEFTEHTLRGEDRSNTLEKIQFSEQHAHWFEKYVGIVGMDLIRLGKDYQEESLH